MKTLLTLFVLFFSSSVVADEGFPILVIKGIIGIIILIFNSYFAGLVFIILGLIVLILNSSLSNSEKTHSSNKSISIGLLGLGFIFTGFIIMFSISNQVFDINELNKILK